MNDEEKKNAAKAFVNKRVNILCVVLLIWKIISTYFLSDVVGIMNLIFKVLKLSSVMNIANAVMILLIVVVTLIEVAIVQLVLKNIINNDFCRNEGYFDLAKGNDTVNEANWLDTPEKRKKAAFSFAIKIFVMTGLLLIIFGKADSIVSAVWLAIVAKKQREKDEFNPSFP